MTTPNPKSETQDSIGVRSDHVCCICKHQWESPDRKTERDVEKSVKVNKDGPYCGMCHHLEMAERYAIQRGFEALEGGIKKWRVMRSAKKG